MKLKFQKKLKQKYFQYKSLNNAGKLYLKVLHSTHILFFTPFYYKIGSHLNR